jgi:hypothetical protein
MKTRVRRVLLPLGLLVVGVLSLALAGCGSGETTTTTAVPTTTPGGATTPVTITVQLAGDQEVPPVQTSASGVFTLTVTMPTAGSTTSGSGLPPGLEVTYKLDVTDIADATAAHIHLAAAGQNGDVIYPLFAGPEKTGAFTGTLAEGTIDEANLTGPFAGKTLSDVVAAVLSGQTYVNVHTVTNKGGEIRGQIIISTAGASTPTTAGTTPTTATGGGY